MHLYRNKLLLAFLVIPAVLLLAFTSWTQQQNNNALTEKEEALLLEGYREEVTRLQEDRDELQLELDRLSTGTGDSEEESSPEEIQELREENEQLKEELHYLYNSLEGADVIRHGDRESNKVVITIDDGWDPFWVVQALLILEEKEVHSTLFPVGAALEKYPTIWKEAVNRGHELGNHTYSHLELAGKPTQQIIYEICKWQGKANKMLNDQYETRFFRPPGYSGFETYRDSTRYEKLVAMSGMETVVLWDVDHTYPLPEDASPQEIADYIAAHTQGGSIILLHFIEEDIKALPLIIDNLHERGFELVTLGEML